MITRAVLFERFAGRDEELRHLVDLRARSARECRGSVVAVVGEAGVGKSRLLSEFEREARAQAGATIRVRCEELPVAYAPVICMFEKLFERRELRRSDSVNAELSEARALLTTIERTSDAAERKRVQLERLVNALGQAAKRLGQLTLLVDDVHWSDLSTLEALRAMARGLAGLPVLLVFTYRNEDLAADNARALGVAALEREGVDRVTLEPLAFGDLAALLRGALPAAPGELLRRIYELSEGLPYVAEELARSSVERGVARDLEATVSLRSAVLERTNRLRNEDRAVIDRAAVLGRNFAPEDLATLGVSEDVLYRALRAGLDLQLLEQRDVDGRPWFRFRHALTRELLYRNLLAIERRGLHLEIADYLEHQPARTAELAYHLAAAGDRERAARACERAGDEATGVAAYGDAATLFGRALDCATEPEAFARLALKRVESLARVGDLDAMLATAGPDAERLVADDRRDDALCVLVSAIRATFMTRFAESVVLRARANGLLAPRTQPSIRFELELLNASIDRMQERNADALAACDRAERALVEATPAQRRLLLHARATTLIHLKDLLGAEAVLDMLAREAAASGSHESVQTEAFARIAHRTGKIRAAVEHSLTGAERWARAGHVRSAFLQRCSAAFFAAEIGDFTIADDLWAETRRAAVEPGQPLEAALLRAARARGGDPRPFVERFERALALGLPFVVSTFARDLPFLVAGDRDLARRIAVGALDATGQVDGDHLAALFAFGSARDVERGLEAFASGGYGAGDVMHAVDAALVAARVAYAAHRPIEARHHAARALELARATEHWLHIANAHELFGDVEAARASLVAAGAPAEAARLERPVAPQPRAAAAPTLRLTAREEQIARLIAGGCSSREAGERLAIAARTVETHVANIYLKLGIKSRAELAARLEIEV